MSGALEFGEASPRRMSVRVPYDKPAPVAGNLLVMPLSPSQWLSRHLGPVPRPSVRGPALLRSSDLPPVFGLKLQTGRGAIAQRRLRELVQDVQGGLADQIAG